MIDEEATVLLWCKHASVFDRRSPWLLSGKPTSGSSPPAGHSSWNLLLLPKEDLQEEGHHRCHTAGRPAMGSGYRMLLLFLRRSSSINSFVSFTSPRQTSPSPAHTYVPSGPTGPCPPFNTPGQPGDVRTLAVDSTTGSIWFLPVL